MAGLDAGSGKDRPMSHPLRVGDRVRLTKRNRLGGYQPGDKGTVIRVPKAAPGSQPYYIVAMDRDGATGTGVLFTEDEIEPDELGGLN
jgi:hypothetical protein